MGKRMRRIKTWMMENAYLVTIGCVIAIVACSAVYANELKQTQQTGVQAAADAPEIRESVAPSPVLTPLPTIAPPGVRPVALVNRGGAWPVSGKVVRAFDAQKSVYWEQLGIWQTHPGLDIAGEAGESVKACMDGTVIDALWDALWGWRVRIAHADGRETIYAGLESCIVSARESVRQGQTIGTLMERIPCEAEMETHLHLEMIREDRRQDPEATLAER